MASVMFILEMRDPHFVERSLGMERGIPVDRGPMERGMHVDRGRSSSDRGISPPLRGLPPMDRRGQMDHPGRSMNPGPPDMGVPRMARPPPPPDRRGEPSSSRPTEPTSAALPDQDQEKVSILNVEV